MNARRIAVVGTCSGQGKTTLMRTLAQEIGAPAVELDSFWHLPGWVEATSEQLHAALGPIIAGDAWVVDGFGHRKLGTLVSDRAQLVVWLDLPTSVWLPRLLKRTLRRWLSQEELWNGNREHFRSAFVGREALLPFAFTGYYVRRPQLAQRLRALGERVPVVRLCTVGEVAAFVDELVRKRREPQPTSAAVEPRVDL